MATNVIVRQTNKDSIYEQKKKQKVYVCSHNVIDDAYERCGLHVRGHWVGAETRNEEAALLRILAHFEAV